MSQEGNGGGGAAQQQANTAAVALAAIRCVFETHNEMFTVFQTALITLDPG